MDACLALQEERLSNSSIAWDLVATDEGLELADVSVIARSSKDSWAMLP